MLYLSPLTRLLAERRHPDIGVIVTPDSHRTIPDGIAWAADNGCYAAGERFSLERYLTWLARPPSDVARCLFATAPDVVGDAQATIARSAPVLPQLRALGYPAAFVAQDGLEALRVPWETFDVLFIGGTTTWKLSEAAYGLIREAKRRGQWVHVCRVNSGTRVRAMALADVDSVDGTYLVFAPDVLWPVVTTWMDGLHQQPALWGAWPTMEDSA